MKAGFSVTRDRANSGSLWLPEDPGAAESGGLESGEEAARTIANPAINVIAPRTNIIDGSRRTAVTDSKVACLRVIMDSATRIQYSPISLLRKTVRGNMVPSERIRDSGGLFDPCVLGDEHPATFTRQSQRRRRLLSEARADPRLMSGTMINSRTATPERSN